MSLETVKCPYCGYVYQTDVKKTFEGGQTTVVRKTGKGSASGPSPQMPVDLSCPNCKEEFEWPVQ